MELKNVEIISIDELKRFDGSEFYCVEWVVKDDNGQYPQFIKLQSNKDKADNLIKFNKVGDKVDVSYNLQGRQWTNPEGEVKTFNTIEAWKVFKAEGVANVQQGAAMIDAQIPASEEHDLPF